ncbi:MAG: NADH-quinone oxidoreductase subunit J family protein [candidate division WOR-3 bacterium]
MILKTILFLIFALAAVWGAISVVIAKHPLRAALGLLLNFFSMGVIYILLNASFLGIAQIIVYAGGIAVFILMAINLLGLNWIPGDRDLTARGFFSILITLAALFGVLGVLFLARFPTNPVSDVNAAGLGQVLLGPMLLAFEVASAILVIGIVAAVALTRKGREE